MFSVIALAMIESRSDRSNGEFQIEQELQKACNRIAMLQQEILKRPNTSLLSVVRALSDISLLLEELQVTLEEIQQQQEELDELERQSQRDRLNYEELFEGAIDAYVITDRWGKIEQVNQAAALLFGYDRAKLLGKLLVMFVVPNERNSFRTRLNQLTQSILVKIDNWVAWMQPIGGGAFPVSISVRPISQPDRHRFHWSIRDLSKRQRDRDTIRSLTSEFDTRVRQQTQSLEQTLAATVESVQSIHASLSTCLAEIARIWQIRPSQLQDETAIDRLQGMQNRIEAIALVHAQLALGINSGWLDLGGCIRQLTGALASTYRSNAQAIAIEVEIDEIYLTVETALPCTLIVNELLSNALRHAFEPGEPGRIGIRCDRLEGNRLALRVVDSGCLPEGFDLETATSPGLMLAKRLTEQLGGTLELTREPQTQFELVFEERG